MDVPERPATPCVLWAHWVDPEGYGRSNGYLVHRMAWERTNGPIPEGLTIDHLCRVRLCVNVEHMEVVPTGVNTLRGYSPSAVHARKTECANGHPFDDANTYRWRGHRMCRACNRAVHARKRRGEK
jgi:hypothetical protein